MGRVRTVGGHLEECARQCSLNRAWVGSTPSEDGFSLAEGKGPGISGWTHGLDMGGGARFSGEGLVGWVG